MDYDLLDGAPCYILGHQVKTRTQITLTCVIPAIFELLIYLFLIIADISVVYQHFYDKNSGWAIFTLIFICMPAIITFLSIVVSPWQWPESDTWTTEHTGFLFRQLFNLIFFPIGAVHRFCRRIFWSIEALFWEKGTYDRIHALQKAGEHSPFELYHFVLAFVHAGPQIMLQLYILLRNNVFQNFETVTAQSISLAFNLLSMGIIVSTYQRFESQKCVGRTYPWASEHQAQHIKKLLRRSTSLPAELRRGKNTTIEFPRITNDAPYPERKTLFLNDNLNLDDSRTDDEKMEKFNKELELQLGDVAFDEVDKSPSKLNNFRHTATMERNVKFDDDIDQRASTSNNVRLNISLDRTHSYESNESPIVPDEPQRVSEDFIRNVDEIREWVGDDVDSNASPRSNFKRHSRRDDSLQKLRKLRVDTENFDAVPSMPPPPLPTTAASEHKIFNFNFERMSVLKDKLVEKTENFLVAHDPRSDILLRRQTSTIATTETQNQPDDGGDEVDFTMPTRRVMIEGIEKDDFIGRLMSTLGWSLFLLMRMIALSVFFVFYQVPFYHLLYAHFILMVVCLFWESKLQEKTERIIFYFFLAYIYIFALLEFKIKFKHIRYWYVGYFGLLFTENVVMTMVWYALADFNSWWYHYIFAVIIFSGIFSLACLACYYILLKPTDKVLFENENQG